MWSGQGVCLGSWGKSLVRNVASLYDFLPPSPPSLHPSLSFQPVHPTHREEGKGEVRGGRGEGAR